MLNNIQNMIWHTFDSLRDEIIDTEEYYVILFLLSLYRDGFIDENTLSDQHELKFIIEREIKNSEKINKPYKSILPIFEPTIQRLSNQTLSDIIHSFTTIDLKILKKHFSEIFDYILYRLVKSQGKRGGEYVQPIELTKFVCELTKAPKNAKVFNPFAGFASFGVFLEDIGEYIGQEINNKTWALGTLRLRAYGKQHSYIFREESSILNWPSDENKYDLIISNPPFGLPLSHTYKGQFPNIKTVEQFLIEKGITSLSENGKMITVLPVGFLFRSGPEHNLRKYLIDSDLIETIISLPGGMLSKTGIPIVVLILNKAKQLSGLVKFIDASKFDESREHGEKILNYDTILSTVRSNKQNDYTRIVPVDKIKHYKYNLNAPRYFKKDFEGKKLSEFLELIRGERSALPDSGKLVRIRDLVNDNVEYFLNQSNIEESKLSQRSVRVIKESCLLLAARWKALKPTFFKYEGKPIFITQDTIAFKVDESIVNVSYLINELHSEYVKEQLEAYRVGVTVTYIKRDDLLKVKINLPSMEAQIAKEQVLKDLSNKINLLQKERNDLAYGQSKTQFNEFSSLKHTLGRPRQNILDWADNILDFLTKREKELDEINMNFSELYEVKLIDAVREIKKDVNYISEILAKGENGLILSEHKLKLISLVALNDTIKKISSKGFKFKLKKNYVVGYKLKDRGISCNFTLLKVLLDNILINANKYGFTQKKLSNEVAIELSEIDDTLVIEIKNNGKPFPKNYDKEKFISKYSTGKNNKGGGIGGYDIHRIANYFNNPDWELILNSDPIYPVKLKFQFSIKSME